MPVLLFFVGFFALVAGLVMIGFGIPINEFSFGNTLIGGGTTALVGGLIIISLSVVVGHLRRIAEALNTQAANRVDLPLEAVEPSAVPRVVPAQGRIPFPARPKAEPYPAEPSAASPPLGTFTDDRMAPVTAPTLRNPEEAALEDEFSLPLPHTPASAEFGGATRAASGGSGSQPPASGWRSSPLPPMRPPAPNFDAMWPADAKATPKTAAPSEPKLEPKSESKFEPKLEPKSEPRLDPKLESKSEAKSEPKLDLKPESRPEAPSRDVASATNSVEPEPQKPRAVAVLKSGVVDGMGYTLYVDGSIEAELPQGTLRFASINELRSHLEKNS